MAYTLSTVVNTVVGNERLFIGYVTVDAAATSVVIPGAVSIDGILGVTGVNTACTLSNAFAENVGPTGTSIAGSLAMTSVVSGGKYLISVLYH
jgi:hypothetical protein